MAFYLDGLKLLLELIRGKDCLLLLCGVKQGSEGSDGNFPPHSLLQLSPYNLNTWKKLVHLLHGSIKLLGDMVVDNQNKIHSNYFTLPAHYYNSNYYYYYY